MTLADWGNYLTVLQVSIIVYKQWITAKGQLRLMYWLMIVGGGLGAISHTLLALAAPEVWGILSTLVLMFWSVAMGIKGLLRLNEDDQQLKMLIGVMEELDGSDTRIIDDLKAQEVPIATADNDGNVLIFHPDGRISTTKE